MKVAYTRQSNIDMDDFDFLTELDYLKRAKQKAADFVNNRAMPGVKDAYAAASERARATAASAKDAYAAASERARATAASAKDAYAAASERAKGIASGIATAASEDAQKAMNKLRNLLGGNGPSQVFQTIMGYLKGIPWLAHLGTRLRNLWGKIKKFGVKTPVSRFKSLSNIAVACIGFIASMVASWAYKIIFGKKDKFKKNSDKFKSQISSNWNNFIGKTESAVCIEEVDMILREDTNGGAFMAMTKRAIEYSKDKIDALWYFCKNGKRRPDKTFGSVLNEYFQKLIDFLKKIIDSVRTILGDAATAIKKRFKKESAFDDSLPALYESIIREAQAHKIKSIKKKAIKKVAMKKARAKKSLRGQM